MGVLIGDYICLPRCHWPTSAPLTFHFSVHSSMIEEEQGSSNMAATGGIKTELQNHFTGFLWTTLEFFFHHFTYCQCSMLYLQKLFCNVVIRVIKWCLNCINLQSCTLPSVSMEMQVDEVEQCNIHLTLHLWMSQVTSVAHMWIQHIRNSDAPQRWTEPDTELTPVCVRGVKSHV